MTTCKRLNLKINRNVL